MVGEGERERPERDGQRAEETRGWVKKEKVRNP